MPRLNLSDAEAALIEKLRARNAKAIGFNEGIQQALDWVHDTLINLDGVKCDLTQTQRDTLASDLVDLGRRILFQEIK